MKRQMINLAIGKPQEHIWNDRTEFSAIGKTTVQTATLKKASFVGDDVGNKQAHGGPDRAVCLYPFEHYSYWEQFFKKKLAIPAFGENITATGMLEEEVCIGDIYKIGDTVVQVSQGRVPCSTISKYNEEKEFLKQVFETTLTGYFFRVLEEGTITSDAGIDLIEKDSSEVTISYATQILFHQTDNKEAIEKILKVDALSEEWRNRFLKLL